MSVYINKTSAVLSTRVDWWRAPVSITPAPVADQPSSFASGGKYFASGPLPEWDSLLNHAALLDMGYAQIYYKNSREWSRLFL